MTNSTTSISLSKETSEHLAKLAELTKQSTHELAERLVREAVELEMEDFLVSKISNERDVEGAETVDFEDIKWD